MTPMMQQYFEIKNKYPDFILFYRLGDFYEMFFDDAQLASSVLGITLTGRDCGEEQRAPMCGVPYHSCDGYIGTLIENGYKVAICEQVEDPKAAKGIVRREVTRIITPGTLIETDLLKEETNNYLATVYYDGSSVGMCFADISTAYVAATSFRDRMSEDDIINELSTYSPREIIMSCTAKNLPKVADFIKTRLNAVLSEATIGFFDVDDALNRVEMQFGTEEIAGNPRSALIAKLGFNEKGWLVQGVRRVITFALVCIAWMAFRANSLHDLGVLYETLFTGWGNISFNASMDALGMNLIAVATTVLCVILIKQMDIQINTKPDKDSSAELFNPTRATAYVCVCWTVAVAWLILLASNVESSFIYFQF